MPNFLLQLSEYYEVIGSTEVYLAKPEQAESNLGDCVADSMARAWDGVDIALINNGGLRSNIIEGAEI